MLIPTTDFTLSDGRSAVLRNPGPDDAKAMLAYLKARAGETAFLRQSVEDCAQFDAETQQVLFRRLNSSPDHLMLLCTLGGTVVGDGSLSFETLQKTRHRASLSVTVREPYGDTGVGEKLLEKLLSVAGQRPWVTQLETELVEGNGRARALYEAYGFRIAGVKPNAVRLPDGRSLNEYLMLRNTEAH